MEKNKIVAGKIYGPLNDHFRQLQLTTQNYGQTPERNLQIKKSFYFCFSSVKKKTFYKNNK